MYHVVERGVDAEATTETINDAVDAVLERHDDNPYVKDKRSGRRCFADIASDLIEHRDSFIGFLRPHGYDEAHNQRVATADDVFPYETPHSRKNGYVSGLARIEPYLLGSIPAMNGVIGAVLADDPVTGSIGMSLGGATALPEYDALNEPYRDSGRRADAVWDAYVERRAFHEEIQRPILSRIDVLDASSRSTLRPQNESMLPSTNRRPA